MGGCRCTYRNCKIKSDGKTHMFHYPVFDKVRCHQWLVNAQRLDFLDLKVSQLKNRCVCQHHFKDESFMNFKRDKLTFEAVPTKNGPFCDPIKEGLVESKIYPNPILVEDIENDFDINDKKSNFCLKYSEFLTNNEFIDSSARYNRNNIKQIKDNSGINLNMPVITSIQSLESVDTTSKSEQYFQNKQPKVKILSEKRIKDPINIGLISGKFEIISPSRPLCLPDKSNILAKVEEPEITQKTLIVESDIKPSEKFKMEVLDVQFDPVMVNADPVQNDQNKAITDKIEINIPPPKKSTPTKKLTPTKNKVTPERSAAIEKKRKFNMKLKDIIESCLDKLDDPLKNYEVSPSLINNFEKPPVNCVKNDTKSLRKRKIKHHAEKVVLSHLAESKSLPSIQEYTIDYLEDRMKKMESTLLNKTAQNSVVSNPAETKSLPSIQEYTIDYLEDRMKKMESTLLNKTAQNSVVSNLAEPKSLPSIQECTIAYLEERMKKMESTMLNKMAQNSVVSHLTENKSLPSVHEYTIAYLEERIKKMESTLLNKIAQNSQEIIDLKNTITKDSSQVARKRIKRIASTQTNENESSYKKFLYQEISKYLKPSLNSIIYEELFISKFSCVKVEKSPSKKKRRRCI
ncbi:muscle M-line assembly protein unc-89 [Maniola hyperantus]|uniref:muscle M-line assembly protein unc-89 n=1 Tax=Aphantopus hyperantus TaxID=2795564 RepID=UPI00374879CE